MSLLVCNLHFCIRAKKKKKDNPDLYFHKWCVFNVLSIKIILVELFDRNCEESLFFFVLVNL